MRAGRQDRREIPLLPFPGLRERLKRSPSIQTLAPPWKPTRVLSSRHQQRVQATSPKPAHFYWSQGPALSCPSTSGDMSLVAELSNLVQDSGIFSEKDAEVHRTWQCPIEDGGRRIVLSLSVDFVIDK